ncbi:MAG: peptidylprolyl isomerase [Candidatus Nanoarchaeia archaeon]
MADEEFVDLDEMVPGSSNKQAAPVQKKEPKKEEIVEQQKEQKPAEVKEEKTQQTKPKEKPAETTKPIQSVNKKQGQPPKKTESAPVIQKKPAKKKKHETKSQPISKKTPVSKKKQEKNAKGKESNWALIALLIIAAVVVAIILYFVFAKGFPNSGNERVVAVVNGEPIYKSEISSRQNLLKATLNPFISEEQVLNLSITDKLLLQEASKKGIITTDEEVKSLLDEIMLINNIDEESLKQDLASKNVSYDYLLELYKNTLTINKLMNSTLENINISEQELQTFYDENKELLKVPEMVQARHILFLFNESPETETLAAAKAVEEKVDKKRSNFCELVETYSDDTASIDACGEYNFSADYPFVPEFLEAGFDMAEGEVRTIRTELGYHIMYKIADIPESTPSLEESRESMEEVLRQQKGLEEYDLLVERLQQEAIIEIYNESVSVKKFKTITSAPPATEEEQNLSVEETPSQPEEIPEITETKIEISKQVVETPKSKELLFVECLNEKGARMFTASWSPDSKRQLEMFSNYASNLNVVECDPDVATAKLELCSSVLKKQFPTWPTWEIGGSLYEGVQSLSTLARNSGCEY